MENRPECELRRQVESELFACPYVDETHMAVRVTDGRVTLSGFARSLLDKLAAEDAARRVSGVTSVANFLEVAAFAGSDAAAFPRHSP